MARTTLTAAQLADYLRQKADRIRRLDLTEVLADADILIRRRVKKSFEQSIDPVGGPWPKRKREQPHPLLVKTGAMMRSATRPGTISGNRLERRIYVRSKRGDDYPEFHQRGTRNMPARPFVGIGNELRDQIIRMVKRRILDMLKGDGKRLTPGDF